MTDAARKVREYANWLQDRGYQVSINGGGHYTIRDPDGTHRFTMSYSPSEYRNYLNTLSDARRAGLPTPPNRRRTKRKADR